MTAIAERMSRELLVTEPAATVGEATERMAARNVGSILVLEGERLVGDVHAQAERIRRVGGRALRGFAVDVGSAHARALGAEQQRRLAAHAAAGAGDHADLALQATGH